MSHTVELSQAVQELQYPQDLRRVRRWMLAVMVAYVFLTRLGLNLGAYSLDASFVALYGLAIALVVSGQAALDGFRLLLFGLALLVALSSQTINASLATAETTSFASLGLLAVIYLPVCLALRPSPTVQALRPWAMGVFCDLALVCAVFGIAQYALQFVYRPDWLFNFSPLLPDWLRGPAGYNTVIPVGERYKSNGFFLREPSSFSFLTAFAAVIEIRSGRQRWVRQIVLLVGLLLSYSGTGILTLLIGLLFPLRSRSLLRLLLAGLGAGLLFWALGDALNLGFTVNRVQEFGNDRSSAYIRYIAPVRMLAESADQPSWALFLGHGAGSITRVRHAVETFDPTWAKVLFEYGLLGAMTLLPLVWLLVRGADPSVRAVLYANWLVMAGHLLAPDSVALIFVLCGLWSGSTLPMPMSMASPAR